MIIAYLIGQYFCLAVMGGGAATDKIGLVICFGAIYIGLVMRELSERNK